MKTLFTLKLDMGNIPVKTTSKNAKYLGYSVLDNHGILHNIYSKYGHAIEGRAKEVFGQYISNEKFYYDTRYWWSKLRNSGEKIIKVYVEKSCN